MLDDVKLREEIESVSYWVYDYVRRAGANGVVIGNSGGKDSAAVIALAVKALGKERVTTVAMPCESIQRDLEDAKLVARTFDVPLLEIDIGDSYNTLKKAIYTAMNSKQMGEISAEADINTRPRIRTAVLYAVAQSLKCLVMGTGNLCERMVGYTTKWGDSASDLAPIADFTVEEVIRIGEILGVPSIVTQKAPADGISGFTDEEKLGVKYSQISEYIETGKTSPEAMSIIEEKYLFSMHKRTAVPIYEVERDNFLEKKYK